MFWNRKNDWGESFFLTVLTVNMKCFEIDMPEEFRPKNTIINRKHEMFWNQDFCYILQFQTKINRKHEMFWNISYELMNLSTFKINRKHEMFWNRIARKISTGMKLLTVNMKCFEII